ncbi:hypothetical protein WJX74_005247 [Apatococcus lobatus]
MQRQPRSSVSRPSRRCRNFSKARAEAPDAAEAGPLAIAKSGKAFKAVKDIELIKKTLPHRYPFLLVDRVVDFEAGKTATGYKNVSSNEQFFNGHFPSRAIMPGVLQVEAMAQLAGIVMIDPEKSEQQENFFFGGIENCKFRKPVVPGDQLMLHVVLTKNAKRFGLVKFAGKAYVGSDLTCEADLTLFMAQ